MRAAKAMARSLCVIAIVLSWGAPAVEAVGRAYREQDDAGAGFVPRSFDGTGNNIDAPAQGAAGTAQVHLRAPWLAYLVIGDTSYCCARVL